MDEPNGELILTIAIERNGTQTSLVHNAKNLDDLRQLYGALQSVQAMLVNTMLSAVQEVKAP